MPDQPQQPLTREELLAIIEQVERTKSTELDLYNFGISKLPEEIGDLTNVEWLVLNGNHLTVLPDAVGRLTNLRWLNRHFT